MICSNAVLRESVAGMLWARFLRSSETVGIQWQSAQYVMRGQTQRANPEDGVVKHLRRCTTRTSLTRRNVWIAKRVQYPPQFEQLTRSSVFLITSSDLASLSSTYILLAGRIHPSID